MAAGRPLDSCFRLTEPSASDGVTTGPCLGRGLSPGYRGFAGGVTGGLGVAVGLGFAGGVTVGLAFTGGRRGGGLCLGGTILILLSRSKGMWAQRRGQIPRSLCVDDCEGLASGRSLKSNAPREILLAMSSRHLPLGLLLFALSALCVFGGRGFASAAAADPTLTPVLKIAAPRRLAPVARSLAGFPAAQFASEGRLIGLGDPGPPIHVWLAPEGSPLARNVPSWVAGYASGG